MNPKLMTARRWRILVLVAAVLLVVGAWPMRYLASPSWEVWVVNDHGQPIPQAKVQLEYQNYSAEDKFHEITLWTDENGHVVFPEHHETTCIFQLVLHTVSEARALVHASFGRHAYVVLFDYQRSTPYWRGKPDSMQSRIVVANIVHKPHPE